MTDLRSDFLQGMSHVATTVNIVTTDGPGGRTGITVSAMSSVSADTDKPTLLVCINDASSGAQPIIENGVFCVNTLRDDQSFISDTFAGRYKDKGEAKFGCGDWTELESGVPALSDALVSFECKLTDDLIVGTHHVFFGEVQQVRFGDTGPPLIYANRRYGTPFRLLGGNDAKSSGRDSEANAVRLSCLDSIAPYFLPAMMQQFSDENSAPAIDVIAGDQSTALYQVASQNVDLGLVYDHAIPDGMTVRRLAALQPYAILPTDHALADAEEVSLADLADENMVLLDTPISRDYFMSVFSEVNLTPKIGMRAQSFELVRALVANGAGYSILVTKPASDLSYDGKRLAQLPIKEPIEPIHLALALREGSELNWPARMLSDRMSSYFAH